jgi:hypothetical protein
VNHHCHLFPYLIQPETYFQFKMVSHSVSSSSPINCKQAVALLFAVFCSLNSGAHAAQAHLESQSQVKPTPFPVCIDDSDCLKMGEGNKYACFQYLCYPWKDDSHVAPKDRRRTCRTSSDCDQHQSCLRHHDKRNVFRGICFDEIKSCNLNSDCSKNYGCCGGNCCEMQYYKIFTDLPCISHMGCQDLGLGKYCCPSPTGNETLSQCCDVDPNPPTTPYPMSASALGAAAPQLDSVMSLLSAILFLAYQQIRMRQ